MRKNPVKEKIKRGDVVIGAFCNIPSPMCMELLGLAWILPSWTPSTAP